MAKSAIEYLRKEAEAVCIRDGVPVGWSLMNPTQRRDAALAAIDAAIADNARPVMSEDEMLQRARRAASLACRTPDHFLDGIHDTGFAVQTALRALRDLDKPVVDPIVLKAREICADEEKGHGNPDTAADYRSGVKDDHYAMRVVVAALKSRDNK